MSEIVPTDSKMKPIVIVQTGAMSKSDINLLRENGLCVVEAKEPAKVRYMEPAPQGYSVQEWAAIELARVLLTDGNIPSQGNYRKSIGSMYADILIRGKVLERVPPVEKA